MKIYILCDMEGVSGIRKIEQVQSDSNEYAHGRELMMQDINAAVDGAFLGGASEVVACDTHGGGGQVRVADMDQRAVYEMPGGGSLMPSLDDTFAGVILLGHHARAGTVNGFLDHTMSSRSWFEWSINGQAMGEIGIEAIFAAHWNVPVIMVSGDQAACDEAGETLGEVECAVVKWGIGRNKAKALPLPRAHDIIRQTAKRAVERAGDFEPLRPSLPATIQLTVYRSDMAEEYARRSGVEQVNARTVRRVIDAYNKVHLW